MKNRLSKKKKALIAFSAIAVAVIAAVTFVLGFLPSIRLRSGPFQTGASTWRDFWTEVRYQGKSYYRTSLADYQPKLQFKYSDGRFAMLGEFSYEEGVEKGLRVFKNGLPDTYTKLGDLNFVGREACEKDFDLRMAYESDAKGELWCDAAADAYAIRLTCFYRTQQFDCSYIETQSDELWYYCTQWEDDEVPAVDPDPFGIRISYNGLLFSCWPKWSPTNLLFHESEVCFEDFETLKEEVSHTQWVKIGKLTWVGNEYMTANMQIRSLYPIKKAALYVGTNNEAFDRYHLDRDFLLYDSYYVELEFSDGAHYFTKLPRIVIYRMPTQTTM